MAEQTAITRTDAIGAFATLLRELRETVGNPSFREMSGRSRAISHTTLHEAAQGNRLPSWSTTVEFVKACGGDPADYRARWDDANRAVASAVALRQARPPIPVPDTTQATHPTIEVAAAPSLAVAVDDTDDASTESLSITTSTLRRPRARHVALGVAAIGLLVTAVVAVGVVGLGDDSPRASEPAVSAQYTSADCPVRQSNPPPADPTHQGDRIKYVHDMTLGDCSHVAHGTTVTKVWRFENVGTVPWIGYSLHRLDLPQRRDQCQTITDVPIDDTRPGELVDIRVQVTAPDAPVFCFVRFKMVDANGVIAFPAGRPVNFQIVID